MVEKYKEHLTLSGEFNSILMDTFIAHYFSWWTFLIGLKGSFLDSRF